jgi:hypothetical protein
MIPGGIGRHVSSLHLLESLYAAASTGSVDEPDDRYPLLAREHFTIPGLVAYCAVGGSSPDSEVIPTDDDAAPFYFSRSKNEVGGSEHSQPITFVHSLARQGSNLMKRTGVEQLVDSFPYSEAASRMLPLDSLRPAHLTGHFSSTLDLVDFFLPAQVAVSPRSAIGFVSQT